MNCLKCGAANEAGRDTCASCWALLPWWRAGAKFIVVPVEPVDEMLNEGEENEVGGHCYSCSKWNATQGDCKAVWTSMILAARPSPDRQPMQAYGAVELRFSTDASQRYVRIEDAVRLQDELIAARLLIEKLTAEEASK